MNHAAGPTFPNYNLAVTFVLIVLVLITAAVIVDIACVHKVIPRRRRGERPDKIVVDLERRQ